MLSPGEMASNGIKQAKKLLRSEILKRIEGMSADDRAKQSAALVKKLLAHKEWQKSRRVSVFLSTEDEICTLDILKKGFETQKRIYVPRYSKSCMEMVELASMDDYNNLPTTSWNIKQPPLRDQTREVINPQNGGLDLIVMPGLGFTKDGQRLGKGGGYYDTYLNHYRSLFGNLPFLVAPTFKQQVVDHIPCTELDVRVDQVLLCDQESGDP